MNEIPTRCNTRADYEYIKSEQIPGWQEHWRQLLEGRFGVIDGDLVEDPRCPLYLLGFTVSEVEEAVGATGYTNLQTDWYRSHPERYQFADGAWEEIDGWREAALAAELLETLNAKLAEVDAAVAAKQGGTFIYAGHQYYMDRDYISDQISALPFLPADYKREWKTADKNGVENVYVVLDKAALVAMAMACFQQFNDNWSAGDAIKKHLKALYAEGTDVSTYEVTL